MELKKENPRSPIRMKLARKLLDMKLSIGTCKIIAKMLKGMTDEQAEKKAGQILSVLDVCESEKDVLKKLDIIQ